MFWSGSSIIIKNTSSCEDPWFHFTYSYQSLRRTPLAPHEVTSKKDVRFAENGSGAPRARERIHPTNFGCDVSVLRPSIHSLGVREGNQVSARGGGRSMLYFLGEKSCDALVQPAFIWREITQEMVWLLSSRLKACLL